MTRLIDRFGKTGFAALASIIWFLPMAAWAGSADLSPIDQTAYPWVALAAGLVMLFVWVGLVWRIRKIAVRPRERRFDIAQMSPAEKRWALATIAFACGAIAWLNAAATVDWTPLARALAAGEAGPILLAVALAAFLVAMLAGVAVSWRRCSAAFRRRLARASLSM